MDEKRRFRRIPFTAQTELSYADTTASVQLADISLKGALVETAVPLPLRQGDSCRLILRLEGSDVLLEFAAEIVHLHDKLCGIIFRRVDIDSMIHLRTLLELNTADPDQVRSEISALCDP